MISILELELVTLPICCTYMAIVVRSVDFEVLPPCCISGFDVLYITNIYFHLIVLMGTVVRTVDTIVRTSKDLLTE
jgi:hypothetical protein